MARCCSQRECVAWSRGRHLFSTRLSLSLSPFLSLSIRSDRYGPKIESWHRESDISRPIYITRRATRLPYVRFQASVHMYACIARGLASRSSFRYPLASRLFEGRRRAALGFPFIDASSSTTRIEARAYDASFLSSLSLSHLEPIGQLPELAITTSAIFSFAARD